MCPVWCRILKAAPHLLELRLPQASKLAGDAIELLPQLTPRLECAPARLQSPPPPGPPHIHTTLSPSSNIPHVRLRVWRSQIFRF